MNPHNRFASSFFTILIFGLLLFSHSEHAYSQTEFIPNDPSYSDTWARQLNLPRAYAYEQTATPLIPEAVVVVMDTWVDCSHPDLQANCLPQYNKNLTDDPNFTDGSPNHGTAVASIIAARVNNGIGPASVAGLTGRVKIISVKIFNAQGLTSSARIREGFRYVLELKSRGVNIVAINCSFAGSSDDLGETLRLIRLLKDQGVYVFSGDGSSDPPRNLDNDDVWRIFATYSREVWNAVAVTFLDTDGQSLHPFSPFGPATIALAAPGSSVPVVAFSDPVNGSRTFSSTSAAIPHATATYSLIRVYREIDPERALERLKRTAVMLPNLQGKVSFGRVDVYAALATNFSLTLVTESGSQRAVAFNSVTMQREPLFYNGNRFSADGRSHVTVLAEHLNLAANGNPASVSLELRDTAGVVHTITASYVGKLEHWSQINFRLPDNLTPGDATLKVLYQGTASNSALVTIRS